MTEETKKPALFLVDGSNYIYRAFYAIRDLSNSKGFPTNAIYGFTMMLIKLLRDWKPEFIAIAFDLKGPTFRHESYEQYKATRKATPDALVSQIPFIKDVVRGFNIAVLEEQGIEADDIIGTLAKTHAGTEMKTVVVSGDKDLLQLVSEDIIMIDTMKDITYDIEAVKARFGVEPGRVVEILGLMGDTSDNIPGVPGIGPKTARRLIEEYGTVEEVIKNVDRVRNAILRENIRKFADQARLSRELATIKTDARVDFALESFRYLHPDRDLLRKLFTELEFSSLLEELDLGEEAAAGEYRLILKADELGKLVERLKEIGEFSIDLVLTSDEPMRAGVVGLSVCPGQNEARYIPVAHDYDGAPVQLKISDVLKALSSFLSDKVTKKHGHDLKNTLIILAREGVNMKGLGCDTMVASYVLNPTRRNFDLTDVVRDHLHRQIVSTRGLVGSGARATPVSGVSVAMMMDYACHRADAIFGLSSILSQKIAEEGFKELFYRLEMPLIPVLSSMEKKGVLLDLSLLSTMSKEIEQLLSLSEEKIYRLAGERFNIASPKQLQTILFDRLGLPRGKKTKEGYSTDVGVLSFLARNHELPAEILAYRSMAKLRSTYIDALPLLVNPDTGRIHTSYNQTVTATGRLSSSNPNLQNIPIRTLEGKRIRQAFISPEGWEIVSSDYSQIELRVLAHLSEDRALIEAFHAGEDIHSRTASDIFGVFPEMINEDMRRQAKVINFGVLYGMSAFGLAQQLGVSQKLAQAYIDGYFNKYHGVRTYLDGILTKARQDGFVSTLLARRRYIPEINSGSFSQRQFAERMAINTPIQGTAADLIKVAMLNISRRFAEKKLSACMIMQVHDELVFEAPSAERDEVMTLVKEEMEGVIELQVPLKVDIASGKNWDEAHG
ncbi:MAG: DNA polymerase I [Syntrophobacterales bacterium CG_4_8_14_3_um_filter_49_14]|nr:MAG: DNA polymerase I [Syntrophobacterales bacterium CG23_combo_of_CG06-09_8_20_14_all_48_27]PJA47810.1 MAG: DNA polymerase I [Syntrophobacterales bacterium CG_4_9_14_3_um_filter_49_8]PJC73152.1 MAG: DNA polymerase I [Syntrophobacterales bacterium CG_4_8_14_3_um_filter_49_14]